MKTKTNRRKVLSLIKRLSILAVCLLLFGSSYLQYKAEKYIDYLKSEYALLEDRNRQSYLPFIFFHIKSKSKNYKVAFQKYYCNSFKFFEGKEIKKAKASPTFNPYVTYIFYEQKELSECVK